MANRELALVFRKPRGENLVKYLAVSYDDFRKEIWVVSVNSYNWYSLAKFVLR